MWQSLLILPTTLAMALMSSDAQTIIQAINQGPLQASLTRVEGKVDILGGSVDAIEAKQTAMDESWTNGKRRS